MKSTPLACKTACHLPKGLCVPVTHANTHRNTSTHVYTYSYIDTHTHTYILLCSFIHTIHVCTFMYPHTCMPPYPRGCSHPRPRPSETAGTFPRSLWPSVLHCHRLPICTDCFLSPCHGCASSPGTSMTQLNNSTGPGTSRGPACLSQASDRRGRPR